MKVVHIAFDVDGTLRANREERHREEVVANPRIVEILKGTAHCKNVELHIWSNQGAEYCRDIREVLDLQKFVKEKNCHKKLWHRDQQVQVRASRGLGIIPMLRADVFRPDIAYDDQQDFDGADTVIVVREK